MTHEGYEDQPTVCPDEWREYASVLTEPPRRLGFPTVSRGKYLLLPNGEHFRKAQP